MLEFRFRLEIGFEFLKSYVGFVFTFEFELDFVFMFGFNKGLCFGPVLCLHFNLDWTWILSFKGMFGFIFESGLVFEFRFLLVFV